MKRTLKLAMAAFLAVIASASCTKEQAGRQPETKVDGMKTIKIVSDVVTKTTLGNNDQPLWKVDDAIAVYNGHSEETVSVIAVAEGGKEGTFLVPDTYGDFFYAVYPEDALLGWDLSADTDTATYVATVDLCSYDGSFGKANIAVGQSEGDKVYLKNAVALLEVTGLPGTGSLSLSKYSTARMDVYFKGEELLTFAAAEQPEDYDLIGINVEDKDVAYYIPVFPGTKTEELELTFTPTVGDAQVMYLKTGVTLARNTIYPVAWRETKVTAQKYEDIKTELEKDETYSGIASDVPVQVEMTMDDANDGDNIIVFPVKTEGKAIAIALNGTAPNGDIIIKNDNDAKSPATLLITAPAGTKLNFTTPNTHVVINGTSYASIEGEFSVNTLVISKGVTVASLVLIGGGLEVHGTLTDITIPAGHNEIVVRDCEGLSETVYTDLKDFIDPAYTTKKNSDGTYDIVKADADAVVMIGEQKYETLAAAITEAQSGDVIKVYKDIDNATGISVPTGKNFTVDFQKHTYAMECPGAGSAATQTAGFQLLKNSTIIFKDGTIECTEANKDKTWASGDASKGIAIMIQNYANLTLEDITIDATNIAHNGAPVRYALSNNCGNVEYKGNTTINTKAGDYAFDVCKYMDYSAPTVTWNSTGTVNGGIELSGGTFVVAKNLAVSIPVMAAEGESTLEIGTGATLSSASDFNDPNPNLTNHKSTAPVQVKQGAGLTICGAGKVEGINNAYSAVIVSINGDDDTKTAKLTVNGNVTLEGNYYGIVGNGNRHKTEILVNGGTIKGVHSNDNIGIYHPQAGKLTITGGTIEGYNSAVEVRGGTVDITGGNLSCTASPLEVDPNGSGSTTKGAALAIAQHTTKKDINVTVNGGTFKGYKAIAIKDAQNNRTTNVNVTYKSGTLNGGITLGHGTFTLGGDLAVKEPVKVIGKTTLNLADYTLSAASGFTRPTAGVIIVNRLGDLTVIGNANGKIDANEVYAAVLMTEKTVDTQDTTNPAKLTVESGSLLGLNYGVVGNGSTGRGNTVITVKGGKIKGTSNESAGIYHPQKGTLTIEGGEIEGSTGIYVKSGDVITSVSAGTIKGTGAKNDYEPCTNGFQSTGDAIVFDNCGYPGGEPNAKISGGTFISTNAAQVGNYGLLPTYQPIKIDYDGYQGPKLTERTNAGPALPAGALKGVFTVADPDGTPNSGDEIKVHFSQGNLWADASGENASNPVLHFENNQYGFSSSQEASHVSYFSWSNTIPNAVSTTNDVHDFLFCNEKHKVSVDGSDNIYYALSEEEWAYLLSHSQKYIQIKYIFQGIIIEGNEYSGLFLYPDNYAGKEVTDPSMTWDYINAEGIVFLPAAGYINSGNQQVGNISEVGWYWTSTPDDNDAYFMNFTGFGTTSCNAIPNGNSIRSNGCAIRLVTKCN